MNLCIRLVLWHTKVGGGRGRGGINVVVVDCHWLRGVAAYAKQKGNDSNNS